MAFLAQLGQAGEGSGVSDDAQDNLRYIHDILERAALEGLDVWMLVRSCAEDFWDLQAREIFGYTLTDLIRALKGKLTALQWNKINTYSPSLNNLMGKGEYNDRFEFASAGSDEKLDEMVFFIVARSTSKPYYYHVYINPFKGGNTSAIYFHTSQYGEDLVDALTKIVNAIPAGR